MVLLPTTSANIEEEAVGGEMEGSKIMQFFNESCSNKEDFIGNLYTDWCNILELNSINQTVRLKCDSWFKMCCDYRKENNSLKEQGLNKIKGDMDEKLYEKFTVMVDDQIEKLSGQQEFNIEIIVLKGAKDIDRDTWIKNCLSCVEQESQLVTHYAKTPEEPMEQDTEVFSKLEALHSKCAEHEMLLGRELSRLDAETNQVDELVHRKQSEESNLQILEELLQAKGELNAGGGKGKVQDIRQKVLQYETDVVDQTGKVESLRQQVVNQLSILYAELEILVEGLSEQLDAWRRQHTLAYVKLESHKNLSQVELWCAKTGYTMYTILTNHLTRLENLLSTDDNSLQLVTKKFDDLFHKFLQKTFVVTEQCGCILKTDKKTWSKVTVRMLGADNTSILEKKVKVHCMFVNEEDINACYHDNILDIERLVVTQQKLSNCETNFAKLPKTRERQFIAEFKKLQLANARVERGNSQKQVHEEKYRLVFVTKIDTHTLWTMSLPLVVNTGANQGCHCLASVMWQCYSTDVYKLPLENKERLPWSEVAAMLGAKMGKLCPNRTLTDDNLRHLKMRLLGSDSAEDGQNEEVSLKQFCIEKLDKIGDTDKKCDFSFWKWFLSCYNLIDKYLLNYWRDGLIDGFLSKKMAEHKLAMCGRHMAGLFLLRFSDGHITDSQGLSSMFGILCSAVSIMRTNEARERVRDIRHLDTAPHSKLKDQNLSNILRGTKDTHNHPVFRVHLSSMHKREDGFDKLCEEGVTVYGYEGVTDAFIVDLEQSFAKIKIETGKHLSSSCDTHDEFYDNKRIKSNSENGKPSCLKVAAGSRLSRSSLAADHPSLSSMLISPAVVMNEATTQGQPGMPVTQVTRKLTTPLSQIAQTQYNQHRAYENVSPASDVATVSSSTNGVIDSVCDSFAGSTMQSQQPAANQQQPHWQTTLPNLIELQPPEATMAEQALSPTYQASNQSTLAPQQQVATIFQQPQCPTAPMPTVPVSNMMSQQQAGTTFLQPQCMTTVPVSNMMSQQQAGTTFLQPQCMTTVPVSNTMSQQQAGTTFLQPQCTTTVPVSNMMSQQQAGTTLLQPQCMTTVPVSNTMSQQQAGTTLLQPQCPTTVPLSNQSTLAPQQQVSTTFQQPQCPTTVPLSNQSTLAPQQQDHSVLNGFDPMMASTSIAFCQDGFNGSKNVLNHELQLNTLKRWIDNGCPPGNEVQLQQAVHQLCSTASQQNPMMTWPQEGNHSADDLVNSSSALSSISDGSLPCLQDSEIAAGNESTSGEIEANMVDFDNFLLFE